MGDLLMRFAGELLALPRHIALNSIAASNWTPSVVRTAIYRLFGLNVSWHASFTPKSIIYGHALTVGPGTTVNYYCFFDCRTPITIGQRCGVGLGVLFISSTHNMTEPEVRAGAGTGKPITVEDGSWIGSNVTVLPGVTIGTGCVVGAGSIVTRDCEPHGLYSGAPARRVRDLPTG
jgi:maltose O-acetyltransferase